MLYEYYIITKPAKLVNLSLARLYNFTALRDISEKKYKNKTDVINDPLGQTHSLASSEHCFLMFCFARSEKWGRTDGRTETTCEKIIITAGRDCGLAEWINISPI